ncbi:hypothetical protein K9L16_00730 [Candidatus Pacearchaeota archaeon]|nr:hypothetical protein [Candidatus Pacearchaeota archaeon]
MIERFDRLDLRTLEHFSGGPCVFEEYDVNGKGFRVTKISNTSEEPVNPDYEHQVRFNY